MVLRDGRTRCLLLMSDPMARLQLMIRLALLGYRYERLIFLSPEQRAAVIRDVLGEKDIKPSNGVFLAALALYLGSPRVVVSGFSFTTAGHAYNDLNLPRNHVNADATALTAAVTRGLPIFTNDPVFAKESGLPLIGQE
jgi:hypothetical protein